MYKYPSTFPVWASTSRPAGLSPTITRSFPSGPSDVCYKHTSKKKQAPSTYTSVKVINYSYRSSSICRMLKMVLVFTRYSLQLCIYFIIWTCVCARILSHPNLFERKTDAPQSPSAPNMHLISQAAHTLLGEHAVPPTHFNNEASVELLLGSCVASDTHIMCYFKNLSCLNVWCSWQHVCVCSTCYIHNTLGRQAHGFIQLPSSITSCIGLSKN